MNCRVGLDVKSIPCVSAELLKWNKVEIPAATSLFIDGLDHVFFSYIRLRPEYDFQGLLEGMRLCMEQKPRVGFIWMGPTDRELDKDEQIIRDSRVQLERVLLLPNADHDQFLSTMVRCSATIRAHACDGVCASVLESLALGVPVIASDDGPRPAGVITYRVRDATDLYRKMIFVLDQHEQVCAELQRPEIGQNTEKLVETLLRS